MRTVLIVALAMFALCSCSSASQHADLDYDTRVARPTYAHSQGPRVVIDQAHGNFHTASGRYQPFANLLASDGYKVSAGTEIFTRPYLAKMDVLVISNALRPTEREDAPAFAADEVRTVADWVRSGGSLFLIADHWPCGGAAAALSDAFGVSMSQGVVEDSVNCAPSTADPRQLEETALVFSRENGLLGDGPITRGSGSGSGDSIQKVVTFTGQSLSIPPGAMPFLKLGRTALDRKPTTPRVDHQGGDTRVSMEYGAPESAFGRAQGVALEFGRGRVVVLGEAAMMTAQIAGDGHPFGMNVPGNDDRQLALNILHWLSRANGQH